MKKLTKLVERSVGFLTFRISRLLGIQTHSEKLPSTGAGEASLSAGSHSSSRPRTLRQPSREPPGASSAFWMSATSPHCWFSGMTHTSVQSSPAAAIFNR